MERKILARMKTKKLLKELKNCHDISEELVASAKKKPLAAAYWLGAQHGLEHAIRRVELNQK